MFISQSSRIFFSNPWSLNSNRLPLGISWENQKKLWNQLKSVCTARDTNFIQCKLAASARCPLCMHLSAYGIGTDFHINFSPKKTALEWLASKRIKINIFIKFKLRHLSHITIAVSYDSAASSLNFVVGARPQLYKMFCMSINLSWRLAKKINKPFQLPCILDLHSNANEWQYTTL